MDHGAKTIKSADFLQKINSKTESEPAEIYLKSNPQNVDIDYWKDIFNKENDE
jgi:hypothetical protein